MIADKSASKRRCNLTPAISALEHCAQTLKELAARRMYSSWLLLTTLVIAGVHLKAALADDSPVINITDDNFDELTVRGEWLITISAPW